MRRLLALFAARRLLVVFVAQAAVLASGAGAMSAASAANASGATSSGIAGRVVAGPTCPVEMVPPQPGCAPRPLRARVRISRRDGRGHAIIVRSGANGRFHVDLAPGAYTVKGLPTSSSGLPRPPAPSTVQVRAGQTVSITLNYDTGIR